MATAIQSPIGELLSSHHTSRCKKTNIIEKIDLDLKPIGYTGRIVYLLNNVFSPEECEALIEHTEKEGYSPALVHHGGEAVLAPGYRDSYRVMIDSKEFSDILFERIGHLLPQNFQYSKESNIFKLKEINERFRFLRYDPGDKFKAHEDGQYARPDGSARTWITLQIYLNEGMKGGETTFLARGSANSHLKRENRVEVTPKTGMVLVFQHNIVHEGTLVTEGQKYTIRTDVLYEYDDQANEQQSKSKWFGLF